MPLIIKGPTGDTILSSGVTGNTQKTLTLPDTTGKILTSNSPQSDLPLNIASTGPAFRVYPGTSAGITSGVFAKVLLNTEEFDTANVFDITNNRFQPNIAGYYQISGSAQFVAASGLTQIVCSIYKNGTEYARGTFCTAAAATTGVSNVSSLISLNGSTDYIELYAYAVGTTPSIVGGSTTYTFLSGFLARVA